MEQKGLAAEEVYQPEDKGQDNRDKNGTCDWQIDSPIFGTEDDVTGEFEEAEASEQDKQGTCEDNYYAYRDKPFTELLWAKFHHNFSTLSDIENHIDRILYF